MDDTLSPGQLLERIDGLLALTREEVREELADLRLQLAVSLASPPEGREPVASPVG